MEKIGALIFIFGLVLFPTSLAQNSVYIGEFRSFAHGVKSGSVYVLDDKTIHITDFYYDGEGPDAWFVVGSDHKYISERPHGGLPFRQIVPDENGSCKRPRKYAGNTIELTLPGNLGINDITYLALYCIEFNHNFGYIKIPRGLQVPLSSLWFSPDSLTNKHQVLLLDDGHICIADTNEVGQELPTFSERAIQLYEGEYK